MLTNFSERINDFIKRNSNAKSSGRLTKPNEIQNLDNQVRKVMPDWYLDLLQTFPIACMEIGIPFNYGWDALKNFPQEKLPLTNTRFYDLSEIEESALELFPGCELINDSFICIAPEENEGIDDFYIDCKSDNPKVIYIYHDCGDDNTSLIMNGQIIANTFSEFLDMIKPHGQIEEWEKIHNIDLSKE